MVTVDLSTIDWTSIGAITGIFTTMIGAIIAYFLRRWQQQRESLNAFDTYRREIVEFASCAIDTMGKAVGLISTNPEKSRDNTGEARQEFFKRRGEIIVDLSSLIDRGRFFFPTERYSILVRPRARRIRA